MMAQSEAVNVDVLDRADGYVIAAWRRLMLLIWRGQASADGIERFRSLFEPWAERQLEGAAFLIVVPGGRMEPPDEKTRAAMKRTARSPAGRFRGMATLIDAEGFVAASVRFVMMRVSSRDASKFFRTTEEAAMWAAALLEDREITAAGLERAIREASVRA